MMEYHVTVEVDGADVAAGTLYAHVRHGVESASFRYDDSYLADDRAFPLAPDMPLVPGAVYTQGELLFRVFEDCMPDRWGRNLMLRAERSHISGLTAVQGSDGGCYSYLDLVSFLEEEGAAPDADIRELWLRVLFSCAIGNVDDHMRNHGFLWEGAGWRLSPAFDVNPTPGDNPKFLRSAIDLDNDDADPAAAIAACEWYRISRDEAVGEARHMAAVLRRWRKAASSNGVSKLSVEHLSSCFNAAIERLEKA